MRPDLTKDRLRALMNEIARAAPRGKARRVFLLGGGTAARDMQDAEKLVNTGMVDAERFQALVRRIPESSYASYPALSPEAVRSAVDDFLRQVTD